MSKKLICYLVPFVLVLGLALGSAQADLRGHWKLDETSGATAADSSGNGNDGNLEGDVSWVPGMIGGAWQGDGAGDYIQVPHSDSLMITDAITVALWMNGGIPPDQVLTKSDGTGAGWQSNYGIRLDDAGVGRQINWRGRAVGNQSLTSPSPIPNNEWVHLTVTFDLNAPGNNQKIYFNGLLDGENTSTLPLDPGAGDMYIGADQFPANSVRWGFQGMMDDFRIYDQALTESEIQAVMTGRGLQAGTAAAPLPEDEDRDVGRDVALSWIPGEFAATHNVYLGSSFDDVNDASGADPRGVLLSAGQVETSVDAGRLLFDQPYYWRVDEVNDAPDFSILKGDVWTFTVEPFSVPITGITATASSAFGASTPEKTIDGSGLVDDLHGVSAGDMWISAAIPATIEYTFDRAYKLHQLWIWNSNQLIEPFVGFGAKDVVIEHSLDGENWTVLDGVGPLAQAPGVNGSAHSNTIDLGGATAQHVRLTVNSVHGIAPQASLSEVRFFSIPTTPTRPHPETGATDVAPDVALSWGRDGREAGGHDIYLGTDPDTLSLVGSVTESRFDTLASDLQLGQTHYWQVVEVNDAMDPSEWAGDVWSFTTVQSIVIDDMESYEDAEFLEIWATWIDGFDDPANSSLVGNGAAGTPETGIVHAGSQSLPLHINDITAPVAEATRTFDQPQDWTRSGIQSLVLYLNRGADDTGGQVYVKINDTKIVYEAGADLPPAWDAWIQWSIDLSTVADAASVRSLTIGVEGAVATGVLYVDSIQLFANAPTAIQPQSWFEAEAADVMGASWKVVADPSASGGTRIGSEDGDGDDNDTAPGPAWVAAYTFNVPADGVYGLALRAQEAGSDSFWVRIVGATSQSHEDPDQAGTGWVRFNEIDAPNGWAWDQVHSNDHGNAVVSWTLPAGTLTLEIAKREDGTYLDAIALMK